MTFKFNNPDHLVLVNYKIGKRPSTLASYAIFVSAEGQKKFNFPICKHQIFTFYS